MTAKTTAMMKDGLKGTNLFSKKDRKRFRRKALRQIDKVASLQQD